METDLTQQVKFLNKIFESIRDPFCIIDSTYTMIRVNEEYARFKNKPAKELIGKKCHEALHGTDSVCDGCVVEKSFMSGDPCAKDREITLPNGTAGCFFEIYTHPIFSDDGSVSHVIEYIVDITDRKRSEERQRQLVKELKIANRELNESEERFRVITTTAIDAIILLDAFGNITFCNEAATKMFGYSNEEAIGKEAHRLLAPKRFQETFKKGFSKYAVSGEGKVIGKTVEFIALRKDRTEFPVEISTSRMKIRDKWHTAGIIRDITERKKLYAELQRLASTDKLTGAYNRARFELLTKREMDRAKRYRQELSLFMFDIDDFKKVNDTYGHLTGDRVLKTIADIVRNNIRELDYLVRWGGEEFMIVAPESSLQKTEVFAERIRKVIAAHSFDKALEVTISLGVTAYKEGDTIDSFISRADDAMYKAKRNGKNRVEVGL